MFQRFNNRFIIYIFQHDAESNLRKAKSVYINRQQDYVRLKEQAQKAETESLSQSFSGSSAKADAKAEKKKKQEDEAIQKVRREEHGSSLKRWLTDVPRSSQLSSYNSWVISVKFAWEAVQATSDVYTVSNHTSTAMFNFSTIFLIDRRWRRSQRTSSASSKPITRSCSWNKRRYITFRMLLRKKI